MPDSNQSNDPVILELFRAEMDAHLPALGNGLLLLEKGQAGDGEIDGMMRAAHSIKGAARIVGFDRVVRLSHAMEDCFTAAKGKQLVLDADGVDVLLQAVDALQRLCSPSDEGAMTDQAVAAMVELIARVRQGKAQPKSVSPSPQPGASRAVAGAMLDRSLPSVSFPGHYDGERLMALRKELVDTLALKPSRIDVDMSQAGNLSAGPLSLLLSFAREIAAQRTPTAVIVKGASESVRTLLRSVSLDKSFRLDS